MQWKCRYKLPVHWVCCFDFLFGIVFFVCATVRFKFKLLNALCRFTISGRIVGAVGARSYSKDGGPSGVKVDLLSDSDELVASALTSSTGGYSFVNIIPG
jgi:hypothetical protein